MSKTVYLVACVGLKLDAPAPARDLYTSPWFLKARALAEHNGDWLILSAEHRVVRPWQRIEPYDRTLGTMGAASRRLWAVNVLDDLLPLFDSGDTAVILAGVLYREYLIDTLKRRGVRVEVPMRGLGIGEQLHWLNERNREAVAA